MKVAIYSTKAYERDYFENENSHHKLHFIPEQLSLRTVYKAIHANAICCFVTDCINSEVLDHLMKKGIRLIALCSAGYDHVDIVQANKVGIIGTGSIGTTFAKSMAGFSC